MATKRTKPDSSSLSSRLGKKAPEPVKRLGRPPLDPALVRSGRLSMRTYPDIAEKVTRVGTEAVEKAIRRIAE